MCVWSVVFVCLRVGIFDTQLSLRQTFKNALQAVELSIFRVGVVVAGPLEVQHRGGRAGGESQHVPDRERAAGKGSVRQWVGKEGKRGEIESTRRDGKLGSSSAGKPGGSRRSRPYQVELPPACHFSARFGGQQRPRARKIPPGGGRTWGI